MNSVHDMGGMQGYGPVVPEPDEPLFHAPWERQALALTLAAGATGAWNIDQSRAARESLPPAVYLNSTYYQIWLRALDRLLLARAMVTPQELASGTGASPPIAVPRVPDAAAITAGLASGSPTTRPDNCTPARFALGDRVRARNVHPSGHTRLPQYVRGHVGTVQRVHGPHVFADRHANGTLPPFDQRPEWLYGVMFEGRELWGDSADTHLQISVDAWEPYLEAA